MVKQISDNEIYLLLKYIKSVLWRVAKRLSYIEDARCLKVKEILKKYSGRAWIGLIYFRIGVTSVNTVLNLRVPYHAGNSLSSRGAINFFKSTLLHGDINV